MATARQLTATIATVGAAVMGAEAYNAQESANKADAMVRANIHRIDPMSRAQLENIEHKKDTQSIILLGTAVLLAAGTAAAYKASKPKSHSISVSSHTSSRLQN